MVQIDRVFRHSLARTVAAALCGFFVLSGVASAQPAHERDTRIVFGHLHVHAADPAVHRKFWIDVLGAKVGHVMTMEVALFPGGMVEWISPSWGDAKPAGGTRGTTVDHVAFSVPSVRAVLDRVTAAGYPVVTKDELASMPKVKEKDGIAVRPDEKTTAAFIKGPDDFLIELVEAKDQKEPITMHHIHFAASQVSEMEAWYLKVTEAKKGMRGSVADAMIPGTHLTFTPATGAVKGTKGSVLDHIGFEVRDLPSMVKQLEAMGIKIERSYPSKTPNGISIAYITDPWGTYIELSEGLDLIR